ncbi:MAG: putative DNA binding domain-containing protein [Clostridiales Family XIII bacterium]|jgi:ATP-dependent DNA helicase RecG|nr:putative DNA binding domain-containing protein [Clostridiales Family XIII bacterium]
MAFEHIRKMIADGEGLTVAFKECVNGLNNSVWETVCSFSNRYGGHLLLGVRDDGEILGVNRAAASGIKKNFANMLNNPQKTSPSLYLSLDEAELDGKLILHAYIPVSSQIQSCSGRIYDRNEDGDFDITNSAELVAHLSIRKRNQFTEREVFPYATLGDLRLDLIPVVKKMAAGRVTGHPWKDMAEMELLKSAGLYETDKRTGKTGFNRAAILLLGREEVIQQVAPGYVTDCLLRIKEPHTRKILRQHRICRYAEHGAAKSEALSKLIGVKISQTRVYLKKLVAEGAVVAEGGNRNKTYRLKPRESGEGR